MIEAKHIIKKFGKLVALNDVNLSFNDGQAISLIGPNGSGKTTFIKCLLGLVVPDKGTITFDGDSIKNNCDYRNKIGYMPQISRFPENIRIAQLIDMVRDIRK